MKTLQELTEEFYRLDTVIQELEAEVEVKQADLLAIQEEIKNHSDMPPKMEEVGDYIVQRSWKKTVKKDEDFLTKARFLCLMKSETKETVDVKKVHAAVELGTLTKWDAYDIKETIIVKNKYE